MQRNNEGGWTQTIDLRNVPVLYLCEIQTIPHGEEGGGEFDTLIFDVPFPFSVLHLLIGADVVAN
jgi:hypothetical protein